MELFLILIWLAFAFGTAHIAKQKGHSYGLWFLLGALLSWLALIVIAVVPPANVSQN